MYSTGRCLDELMSIIYDIDIELIKIELGKEKEEG